MSTFPETTQLTVAMVTQNIERALSAVENVSRTRLADGKSKTSLLIKLIVLDLDLLEGELLLAFNAINKFRNLWGTDVSVSDTPFTRLWGEEGHSEILTQWRGLDIISRTLRADICHLTQKWSDSGSNSRRRRIIPSWFFLRKRHGSEDASDMHDLTEIKGYEKKVLKLIEVLFSVQNDADSHFRRLHGPARFLGLTKYQYVPTTIYNLYRQLNQPLYLDLRLIDGQKKAKSLSNFMFCEDLPLSLHIILASDETTDKVQHLNFKRAGVVNPEVDDTAQRATASDTESLRRSLTKDKDCISFHVHADAGTEKQAIVAESFTTNIFEEYLTKSFGLRKVHSEQNNPLLSGPLLSVSQKISLAAQLAQATLILFGTPWLSHMSCDNIRQLRTDSSEEYMCLYIDPKIISSVPEPSYFATIQQQQIFVLGLTLLELAMDEPLDRFWKQEIPPRQVLDEYRSLYHQQIERTLGFSYARACEFCFNETVREDDNDERDLEREILVASHGLDRFIERCYLEVLHG